MAKSCTRITVTIILLLTFLLAGLGANFQPQQVVQADAPFTLIGPPGSGKFGSNVEVLPNGNILVADPHYSEGSLNSVGAVYLYDGATGAMISKLTGSSPLDYVGWIRVLKGGDFVVASSSWDNGDAVDAGAVTWCSGTTGCNGAVSPANSLVGSSANDNIGSYIWELENGHYVVFSNNWSNGSATNAGAVTWCDGGSGCRGVVSAANSLVGSHTNDKVGYSNSASPAVALSNGAYVVESQRWRNGMVDQAGAVTWCSGTTPCAGELSAANSLVGTANDDLFLGPDIIEIDADHYLMYLASWNNGSTIDAGAVAFCASASGCQGTISSANSLIGTSSATGRQIYLLSNHNYVVVSANWKASDAGPFGAVTWCSAADGCKGPVTLANSLVGIPNPYVTPLNNGNYVVTSEGWSTLGSAERGIARWCSGQTGCSGDVAAQDALVGTSAGDRVGHAGVSALADGNYVVVSPYWDNDSLQDVGAVTWCDGTAGCSGPVSPENSLVGNSPGNSIGSQFVTPLGNGNYVVKSHLWDNGETVNAGAVTWCPGASGCRGTVLTNRSLVGNNAEEQLGVFSNDVTELANHNYVVLNYSWDRGAVQDVGAVALCSGDLGCNGTFSESNSLVGSSPSDHIGSSGIWALKNGNYLVMSPTWNHGTFSWAGAITWCSGVTGCTGEVTPENSLVGGSAGDQVGFSGSFELANGNFVIDTHYWHNLSGEQVGALTWCSGKTGCVGVMSPANSLVGGNYQDSLLYGAPVEMNNGNYYVFGSLNWATTYALTYGPGWAPLTGIISSDTSLLDVSSYKYIEASDQWLLGQPALNRVVFYKPVHTSIASGDWAQDDTWNYGAPVASSDVQISSGDTVTIHADQAVHNLVIDGQLDMDAVALQVSGDWNNQNSFNPNLGRVVFNAAGWQTIQGDTTFHDITVNSGTTLTTQANVTLNGALTNHGTTIETQTISGAGLMTYGLADIRVEVKTPGSLSSLQVSRQDQTHPQAFLNRQTGRYWTLAANPGAQDFLVDLTLPTDFTPTEKTKVCRYTGSGYQWDCAQSAQGADWIQRSGITAFSDWTVLKDDMVYYLPEVNR